MINKLTAMIKALQEYVKNLLSASAPSPELERKNGDDELGETVTTATTAPPTPQTDVISSNLLKDFWQHITLGCPATEQVLKATNHKLLLAISRPPLTPTEIAAELERENAPIMDDIFSSLDQANARIEQDQQAVQVNKIKTRTMLGHLQEITKDVG